MPALNQLLLPFLSLVSAAELHRNPTVKAEAEAAGHWALSGLLPTYPVHQAADILFCQANLVPVGRDQLPHLELTRTIARRFNQRYGAATTPLFPESEPLLSAAPLLLGLDGQKMSKSRSNSIALRDDEDRTAALLRQARTDGERQITYEPGQRPEVANLLLTALCSDRTPEQVAQDIGDRGASALKAVVTEAVNERLRPIRRRRAELAADPGFLLDVLAAGNVATNDLADATLQQVRQLMRMEYRPVA